MEKQEKAFCLVHAFNMAIGGNISSGNQVLAHVQEMEDTLTQRRLDSKSLDHFFYTKNKGNFNNSILNPQPFPGLPSLEQRKTIYVEIRPISII